MLPAEQKPLPFDASCATAWEPFHPHKNSGCKLRLLRGAPLTTLVVLLALRLPVPVPLEVWLGVPVWLLVGVCEGVAVRLPLLDGELDRLADAVRLLLAVSELDGEFDGVIDGVGVIDAVGVFVGVGPAP